MDLRSSADQRSAAAWTQRNDVRVRAESAASAGLAARDAKARRGELRFALPPGYCWDELGRIEIDPDEGVAEAIGLLFRKFRELGSVPSLPLDDTSKREAAGPSAKSNGFSDRMAGAAYHTVVQVLKHPMYAGAYVFGRTTQRTQVIDGRARKSMGTTSPWKPGMF